MEKEQSLLSFLNVTESVIIVANPNIEGNPVVTALIDKVKNLPRTDMLGKPIGSIRLEQRTRQLNGSYLNSRNRVAFLSGTMEELEGIVKNFKLADGSKVPGKIVVTESLQPMWAGQTPKINPNTEVEIGVEIINGENKSFFPVFMKMEYTEDLTRKDRFIRTPEDVNSWYSERKVLASVAPVMNAAAHWETAGIPQAADTRRVEETIELP